MEIKFDKKEQLEKIQNRLVPGEQLYAVYDMKGGGTGFIGITDVRLIFMDKAFLKKKKAMVSLPYTKLTVIASEDSGAILFKTSKLMITAGQREWEFEFRSSDKAHHAYELIMMNLLQTEAHGM
jgi:hypothetical protein